MNSYFHTPVLTCPRCKTRFETDVWLIVDCDERPDLLAAARQGHLHDITCPKCGLSHPLDPTFLLYCPVKDVPLLFVRNAGQSDEAFYELRQHLLELLAKNLGDPEQVNLESAACSLNGLESFLRRAEGREVDRPEPVQPTYSLFSLAGSSMDEMDSYSVAPLLTCPRCQTRFDADVWLIIDCVARPDLFAAARQGHLHDITCPKCGDNRRLEPTFLLYRPVKDIPLIFVRGEGQSDEEYHQQRQHLLEQLADSLGNPKLINSSSASVYLSGLESFLRRSERRESGEPEPDPEPEQPAPDLFRLVQAVNFASGLEEIEGLVSQYPQLLENEREVEAFYDMLLYSARTVGDHNIQAQFEARRELLRRFRQQAAQDREISKFLPSYKLAVQARQNFYANGDPSFLDMASGLFTTLLEKNTFLHTPATFQLDVLNNLAEALTEKVKFTSNQEDLERAYECLQRAGALDVDEPELQARGLFNLAKWHNASFELNHEQAELEQAIACYEQVASQIPADAPQVTSVLSNLGNCHLEAYLLNRDQTHLRQAVHYLSILKQLGQPDSPAMARYEYYYSRALLEVYQVTQDVEALDEAVAVARRSTGHIGPGSYMRSQILLHCADALQKRFDRQRKLQDLDEAIDLLFQIQQSNPDDCPRDTLQNWLEVRFYEFLQNTELQVAQETALTRLAQMLEMIDVPSESLQTTLFDLGNHLDTLYTETGQFAVLEANITLHVKVLRLLPPRARLKNKYLFNYAHLCLEMYRRTGRADLLEIGLNALPDEPAGSDIYPAVRNLLATLLRQRFGLSRQPQDLEHAIAVLQELVDQTPTSDPEAFFYANNLANSLANRYYAISHDSKDILAAAAAYQQAAKLAPADAAELPMLWANLGISSMDLYYQTSLSQDLDQAISSFQKSLASEPSVSPNFPDLRFHLGSAYHKRFELSHDSADLTSAIECYRHVCKRVEPSASASPAAILAASQEWSQWALERSSWEEAAEASMAGLDAADQLFTIQSLRDNQEDLLAHVQHLPADAAYALARSGREREAVEVLEHWHGRWMATRLARREADLDALTKIRPGLARNFRQLISRLETLQQEENRLRESSGETSGKLFNLRFELNRLYRELEAMIEEIRQVENCETFLQPLAFSEIVKASSRVQLVYLAVSSAGGLALLPTPSGAVLSIWMDGLSLMGVNKQTLGTEEGSGYIRTYIRWLEAPLDTLRLNAWLDCLDETCAWLWEVMMGEVTRVLQEQNISRAVLVPGGYLNLLPLHAAWSEVSPGKRLYALDRVEFCYASGAAVLLRRARDGARPTGERFLALSSPDPRLEYSRMEVQAVSAYFPVEATGSSTSKTELLALLPQVGVFHASTHALANYMDPLEGGLSMGGGEWLRLKDVLELHLDQTRLVVLSACETGLPGFKALDESVSLAAGLIEAGAWAVISTLWAVREASTLMVVLRFYDNWRAKGQEPPTALREAQIWLRDSSNREKQAYFRAFLPELGGPQSPLADPARSAYRLVSLDEPDATPYSHPYYWAALGFNGMG